MLILIIVVSIKAQTTGGCWLGTYGRGVGTPLDTCPEGQDKNGALCYPQCQSGYNGVGPVC